MDKLADIITDRRGAGVIVALVLLLAAASLLLAGSVEQEDDLLAFLPQDNPDIALFQDINQRFGGLDVAMVGIDVEDAYAPESIARLRDATAALQARPNLDHVLSLANVDDFTPDPMGGIRIGKLVESVPETPEDTARLRALVESRPHIRGALVSEDGGALVLYAFAAYGADVHEVAAGIRADVEAAFPDTPLYWGGSPFVSTFIYDTTQADVARLTPWAVGAIVLLMLVAFRDWKGTLLGLGATGLGIVSSQALMSVLGVPLNVILGSMPIILFAVGSAYAIHVLSRYQAHRQDLSCEDAVRRTVTHTGPTVLTAGLTTALGLGSFVVMDIEPMRIFGVFTAFGIVVTLALSVVFVPAVIRLLELPPRRGDGPGPLGRASMALAAGVQRRRGLLAGALAVVAVAGAVGALRVDNRIDQRTFYDAGSPPDLADAFFTANFGGSTFIQIWIQGDLSDPLVLREVRLLGDRMAALENVHAVQHVGDVVGTLNDAMESQARIPDTRAKVEQLYGLLTGNPSVRQLVTDERDEALMHVRLSSSDLDAVEQTLAEVEALAASVPLARFVARDVGADPAALARLRDQVSWRVVASARSAGVALEQPAVRAALDALEAVEDATLVEADLARFLASDESWVELSDAERGAVAAVFAATALPDDDAGRAALAAQALATAAAPAAPDPAAFADDPRVGDLAFLVEAPLSESRLRRRAEARADRLQAALAAVPAHGQPDGAFRRAVSTALLDLDAPTVALPDAGADPALSLVVNGMPVLHRGLSSSTTRNQLLSLAFALGLVAVALSWRFSSLRAGLLATAPMGLALLVVYGAMGALGVHLDIGTSMLASIVIGAGVDYAVHLLSAWYAAEGEPLERAAARAAARTGPAIWTNALMVAVGFFVLTLGEARPLRNVGGLTAAAMLTAAITTFLVLPVLAGRRRYSVHAAARDPADGPLLLPAPPAPESHAG